MNTNETPPGRKPASWQPLPPAPGGDHWLAVPLTMQLFSGTGLVHSQPQQFSFPIPFLGMLNGALPTAAGSL